ARRLHFARFARVGARLRVGAVEAPALAVRDATRRPGVVEENAGRERVELDVEAVAVRRGDVEQALARAGAPMSARRERRVAQALEAAAAEWPGVRVAAAAEPAQRARQRRRQAADESARRAPHHLHERLVAEGGERDRLLGAQ